MAKKVVKSDAEVAMEEFVASLAGKTAEELTEIATEQFKANQENEALVTELNAMIKAASKEIAKSKPVVTYNKKSYEVVSGSFSLEGKIVTAADLVANNDLVKLLVEKYDCAHLKAVK